MKPQDEREKKCQRQRPTKAVCRRLHNEVGKALLQAGINKEVTHEEKSMLVIR